MLYLVGAWVLAGAMVSRLEAAAITAATGNDIAGAVAGIVGAALLSGVGVQALRAWERSRQWDARTIERLTDELEVKDRRIERLEREADELRAMLLADPHPKPYASDE